MALNPKFLQHVAIPVPDVNEARKFYTEVLGLPEGNQPDLAPGHWPSAYFLIANQRIHVVQLENTSASRGHFALEVDDLEAAIAELERMGVPVERKVYAKGQGYQAFIADPGGNKIELNQPDQDTFGVAAPVQAR